MSKHRMWTTIWRQIMLMKLLAQSQNQNISEELTPWKRLRFSHYSDQFLDKEACYDCFAKIKHQDQINVEI